MAEEEKTRVVVLTKPLSLEIESNDDYRAPNLLQRVLSLFKDIRPGSDLTRFQLPPLFNIPKSHLQCFGEPVFCVNNDMLGNCNNGETPKERFTAVVSWSLSILRPMIFGIAPYNPILGETHHVSRGSLNVLLEQVSHHPPVTALHATDEKSNVEMIWCQHATPKFYGTSVEAELHGKRELKLLNHGETYKMNSPKVLIKFLPVPGANWVGENRIQCHETGLEAKLYYGSSSFFSLKGNPRSVKGKIFESSSLEVLYEIDGQWDRTVKLKDVNSGKETVIYNAKEAISGLKSPVVTDLKGVWPSESAVVWGMVSQAILNKDWGRAREEKKVVEEKQRELVSERESRGTSVETELHGKRELKLLNHGETYKMNFPKLLIKFLPVPGVNWVGENRIQCHETGLEAELYYGSSSFFGLRGNPRSVKGKIFDSSSLEVLYEIDVQNRRIEGR